MLAAVTRAGRAGARVGCVRRAACSTISAGSFEAKLASLSYRAPAIVSALVADAGLAADKTLDVLDAGCGTGLCGPLLAPYARRLIGRRFVGGHAGAGGREGRLRRARQRRADGVSAGASRSAFDVIVSADTLVYFGALEDVSSAAARGAAARRHAGVHPRGLGRGEWRGDVPDRHAWALPARARVRGARARRGGARVATSCAAELRMEAGLAGRRGWRCARPEGHAETTMPRVMEISTPLGADVLLFHRCTRTRNSSRLSDFQLELLSPRTTRSTWTESSARTSP